MFRIENSFTEQTFIVLLIAHPCVLQPFVCYVNVIIFKKKKKNDADMV